MPAGDLLDEAYQWEYDGERFGAGTTWMAEEVSGWDDLPDLDGGDYPLAGNHGTVPGLRFARGNRTTMVLYLEATTGDVSIQDEVDRLKRITQPRAVEIGLATQRRDGLKTLRFARPIRRALPTDLDFVYGSPRAVVEWAASDPVLYSTTLDETPIPVFVGSGGLSYDVTYDKDYGASGSGLTSSVPNGGDWETWPRFEITGPSSGTVQPLKIENVTTGEEIIFTGLTIPTGSTLVVETHPARRTVRFTDGANRWNTVASTSWWPIAAGGASLRFRASGTIDGVTCTCETRDAYL